jgi:hypothetical protein
MLKYALAAAVVLFAAGTAWSVDYDRPGHGYARIDVLAAPQCGGAGTARIAQKQAAIETIKDGFDRYEIVAVGVLVKVPSTANLNYKIGPLTVSAARNQAFIIRQFKDGQLGSEKTTSAKKVLGPNWAKIVKDGAVKCGP